jgi:hypothetical protein
VFFDPEKPADKILDRDILPTVERLCTQVIAADHQWYDANPNEFIDVRGVKWVRGLENSK